MDAITTKYIYDRAKEIENKSKFVNGRVADLKVGMSYSQTLLVDRVMQEVMELAYMKFELTRLLDEN